MLPPSPSLLFSSLLLLLLSALLSLLLSLLLLLSLKYAGPWHIVLHLRAYVISDLIFLEPFYVLSGLVQKESVLHVVISRKCSPCVYTVARERPTVVSR